MKKNVKKDTKNVTPKDYDRWGRTPIVVTSKPQKKVKRGK